MVILCGTDFSAHGSTAMIAAASIALRAKSELMLVHASEASDEAALKRAREELARSRERIASWPIEVESAVVSGIADEAIVAHASRARASMIVVGPLGRRSERLWSLGSTADRTAQVSKVPVLIARASDPFEKWARESRPLSVLLAVDATSPSDAAARWLAEFAKHGALTITAAHVYWPPGQLDRSRAGSPKPSGLPIGAGHADIERELARELGARFAPIFGALPFDLNLVGGLGRPADHLVQMAQSLHADVIVVGNHQRAGLERFWHGSVSHGVVHRATTSVVCVPST